MTPDQRNYYAWWVQEHAEYYMQCARVRAYYTAGRGVILVIGLGFYTALQYAAHWAISLLHPSDLESTGLASVSVIGGLYYTIKWVRGRLRVIRAWQDAATKRRD